MELGFFHPSIGYWQAISTPSADVSAAYPEGTVEVPLKPGEGYEWGGSQWVESAPVVVVPQEVTAFQARAALANSGYLEVVTAYMDTLSPNDVSRLAWEHALTFKRTSPTIAGLAPLLGMDDAQLDQLFIAAAQIDA